jgi:hypothetical protein
MPITNEPGADQRQLIHQALVLVDVTCFRVVPGLKHFR